MHVCFFRLRCALRLSVWHRAKTNAVAGLERYCNNPEAAVLRAEIYNIRAILQACAEKEWRRGK